MSLSSENGFTPVVDALVKEHGLVTAVVFGAVWRYCQMQEKVCRASLEVIGDRLGLDKATVKRHINTLCENGYLKDLTPGKRNAPHVYVDTGKVEVARLMQSDSALESHTKRGQTVADDNSYIMEEGIETVEENNSSGQTVAQDNSSKETVAENNATVAQCNATVAESRLKIDSKIPSKIEESIITLGESDSLPEPPKKKRARIPKPSKPPSPKKLAHNAMFTALADLCQYNLKVIRDGPRMALNTAAKYWLGQGVTPENMQAFSSWWYENDWRGKKGQPPVLGQIRDTWGQFENRDKARQNGHHKNTATNQTSISGLREKGSDNPVKKRFNPTTGETYWVDIRTNQRVPAPDSA